MLTLNSVNFLSAKSTKTNLPQQFTVHFHCQVFDAHRVWHNTKWLSCFIVCRTREQESNLDKHSCLMGPDIGEPNVAK